MGAFRCVDHGSYRRVFVDIMVEGNLWKDCNFTSESILQSNPGRFKECTTIQPVSYGFIILEARVGYRDLEHTRGAVGGGTLYLSRYTASIVYLMDTYTVLGLFVCQQTLERR